MTNYNYPSIYTSLEEWQNLVKCCKNLKDGDMVYTADPRYVLVVDYLKPDNDSSFGPCHMINYRLWKDENRKGRWAIWSDPRITKIVKKSNMETKEKSK